MKWAESVASLLWLNIYHSWKLNSPLIISPSPLSRPVAEVSVVKDDNYSLLSIIFRPTPLSHPVPLETSHLTPCLFFFFSARSGRLPHKRTFPLDHNTHSVEAHDVEEIANYRISHLHFNIVFTVALKLWTGAISVFLESEKQKMEASHMMFIWELII